MSASLSSSRGCGPGESPGGGRKNHPAVGESLESAIKSMQPLGIAGPWDTPDPFLFLVYHKDHYPAGDAHMQAPRRGNGADFDPSAPYRMYHGDRIPGFPQHPHRGFETITATLSGLIDHTDSLGNGGRYGYGDLQWMTAGKGIVHGEMFPLLHMDQDNPCSLFQIWINLPAKDKMVEPNFVMHWAENVSKIKFPDGLVEVTVWAGTLMGASGQAPPPNSWASEASNEVAVWRIVVRPGGVIALPPAAGGSAINRSAYICEGDRCSISGRDITRKMKVDLRAEMEATIRNTGTAILEILILQGRPLNEPVVQHGPFVMSTRNDIIQAFADYQKTQFGGWPWPNDAMVFPRDKGRFALLDGVETNPPEASGPGH